ncbi:MAG: hypothetical protein U9N85_11170 [Bacteroidota bacterium]|nr:hypothetical protein [Bacteroidota bacterium]
MKNRFRNILLLVSILLLNFTNSNAQMHCRSTLGGHLTPFHEKVPLLWAVEGTMAPGIMTSPYTGEDPAMLNGGMLIGALDFTTKKHTFYVEGGYKNWKNSELTQPVTEFSRDIGMRQAFYGFKGDKTNIKLGLHETKLGNYFLIDERILGASLDREIGAFTLNARAGTVMDMFARMGRFCGNRHLYNLIINDFTENIGEKAGETNLAGFVLNWNPNYKKPQETDEFDEFDEFSESSEFGSDKKELVSNIGLIVYDEFGEIIPNNKLYLGTLVDFNLPAGFTLQTGGVYQNMELNNTLVYIASLGKSLTWGSGAYTKLGAAYIGKYNIDEDAIFQPLFSNMFLGEIMRLDAVDFPLWQASLNHNFPGKLKFNIGLKAVGQIEANKTSEIDLEFGMKLFNHAKITTIFSWVDSQLFPEDIFMSRLELRIAF